MSKSRLILPPIIFLFLACAGCASIRGAPEQIGGISEADLEKEVRKSRIAYMTPPAGSDKTRLRNNYIFYRMRAIDHAFVDYIGDLGAEDRTVSLMTTLGIVGVGAAGSVVGQSASRLLSAASGGIAGASEAYDKELLFDQTLSALVSAMRTKRAEARLRIVQKVILKDSEYPLIAAEADLQTYEEAGRIDLAIASVIEQAAATARTAEQAALNVQIKVLAPSLARQVIDNIERLTFAEARELARNLPVTYSPQELSLNLPVGGLDAALRAEESTKLFLQNLVLNKPDEEIMNAWLARFREISQ